ncbi:MAG TPA: type II toxin-antitoxin system VapC family toxin [Terracidiphilus sp.]|jgi:PIN domain nuclease of toxin-antitoxin system|nr:type II toxin-antitoxin system VapC family toxin [Terracidiphilus sp.]
MILLDTHVVVWLMADPDRLSTRSRERILRARVERESIAYSPVTIYEIAYSVRRNRLPLRVKVEDFIAEIEKRLRSAPLTTAIAVCAAGLPEPFHGDPLDRIIAATAIVENCTLVTADTKIHSSGVYNVVW